MTVKLQYTTMHYRTLASTTFHGRPRVIFVHDLSIYGHCAWTIKPVFANSNNSKGVLNLSGRIQRVTSLTKSANSNGVPIQVSKWAAECQKKKKEKIMWWGQRWKRYHELKKQKMSRSEGENVPAAEKQRGNVKIWTPETSSTESEKCYLLEVDNDMSQKWQPKQRARVHVLDTVLPTLVRGRSPARVTVLCIHWVNVFSSVHAYTKTAVRRHFFSIGITVLLLYYNKLHNFF